MSRLPIGVFDSGLGGITAVRELRRILPRENIVYFGDTGRVPYGNRGRDIIIAYTKQDIAFLLSQKVKVLLAACGTISSTFPPGEAQALPVPYLSVLQPTVHAALAATKTGRVGVIATEATVASGSYQTLLRQMRPDVQCITQGCPLFVPLVENGHFAPQDPMVQLAVQEYLPALRQAGIDTLILGCTHYPLLADAIETFMGPDVTLIDSGREAALALRDALAARQMLNETGPEEGTIEYYVSDDPVRFSYLAEIFLQGDAGAASAGKTTLQAKRIRIEKYSLDWILKGWMPGVE